jgi:hypothetical protein
MNLNRPEVSELFGVLAAKLKLPRDVLKLEKSTHSNLFEYYRLKNPMIDLNHFINDLEPYRNQNPNPIVNMSGEQRRDMEILD